MSRVFIIVLDSLGIGAAPDSEKFGDSGANTLLRISKSKNFNCPVLRKAGLFNIEGLESLGTEKEPLAAAFKMQELSSGKDTITGHWEIAGIISENPMPTYPNGFPDEVIEEIKRVTGRGVLCNKPYSGTEVLKDYGNEHIQSGDLIVYTSADSVLQIAAHERVVPLETLYEYCEAIREIMCGEHAVGRIIARPFVGKDGEFKRTANRRDFSLEPPYLTLLDEVYDSGLESIAVGKISDIFAGQGINISTPTHSNDEGMEIALDYVDEEFEGLCFVNLVDFDSQYGHRQDIDGYAAALSEFDAWLGSFLPYLDEDDLLMITADHGCDPGDDSTDHTREYTPLLIFNQNIKTGYFGIRKGFCDIGKTAAEFLEVDADIWGESLLPLILKEN